MPAANSSGEVSDLWKVGLYRRISRLACARARRVSHTLSLKENSWSARMRTFTPRRAARTSSSRISWPASSWSQM